MCVSHLTPEKLVGFASVEAYNPQHKPQVLTVSIILLLQCGYS